MSKGPTAVKPTSRLSKYGDVPQEMQRAMLRLNFPPSYVVVGAYRLFTDKSLYAPAWKKCRNGARRGLICGFAWTCISYNVQRRIIKVVLAHPVFSVNYITKFTETADDLSHETFFGIKLPFRVSTYIAILLVGSQCTSIINYFVARNIRIARQRVWDQTVASRGKGPDFWQPYVEEWDSPPLVDIDKVPTGRLESAFKMWFWKMMIQKVILLPLSLYPLVGTFVAAAFRSFGTAQALHKPYFAAKKMSPHEIAVFVEERKWEYRTFGYVASLLEGLPLVGLIFAVSNAIGAAMWAHDLEKRQHYIASERH